MIKLNSYFSDLVFGSSTIVDKTILIKRLIENEDEAFIITMHRWFVKTLNLDKIKTFFEIVMVNDEPVKDPETKDNYKLFASGKAKIKVGDSEF